MTNPSHHFDHIRIQGLKKFVTDTDPGKKDSVPGKSEKIILKNAYIPGFVVINYRGTVSLFFNNSN